MASASLSEERKILSECNDLPAKRKPGRPKGSKNRPTPVRGRGNGQQVVVRLRKELEAALDILEGDGRPLSEVLAQSLQDDAPRTLAAIGRYLPAQVSIEADSGFLTALQQVGEAIQLERGNNVIDITPERPRLHENATEIALTD